MPAEYERCVRDVKAQGKVDNPFAVCRASMGTDEQILRRRKSRRRRAGRGRG